MPSATGVHRTLGQRRRASSGPSISVGDRRLGEEADGQVGDGDADLGAGELGGQRLAGRAARRGRRASPLGGGALDAARGRR